MYSRSRMPAMRATSSSVSSFALRCGLTLALLQTSSAVVGPMPRIYRSEIWVGFSLGRSTPRIRGMHGLLDNRSRSPKASGYTELPLTLLVTRVGADDVHAPLPLHQLAILANSLDART